MFGYVEGRPHHMLRNFFAKMVEIILFLEGEFSHCVRLKRETDSLVSYLRSIGFVGFSASACLALFLEEGYRKNLEQCVDEASRPRRF